MALTVNFALICLIGFLDGPWFLHYITLHSFSSTLFSLQEFSQTNMWGVGFRGLHLFWDILNRNGFILAGFNQETPLNKPMSVWVNLLLIILATYWLLIASSKINHILKCINSWYIFVQLYIYIYTYMIMYTYIQLYVHTYIHLYVWFLVICILNFDAYQWISDIAQDWCAIYLPV